MDNKIKEIVKIQLEIFNEYCERILESSKEKTCTLDEIDKNTRVLNGISANLERFQRLELKQPLTDWGVEN